MPSWFIHIHIIHPGKGNTLNMIMGVTNTTTDIARKTFYILARYTAKYSWKCHRKQKQKQKNTKKPRLIHNMERSPVPIHYSDFIKRMMASEITSLTIVYLTVYSCADQRKHESSTSLDFVRGNSQMIGELPAQRASNAENVSIWWRHRMLGLLFWYPVM